MCDQEPAPEDSNDNTLTVTELTHKIKGCLEGFGCVWLTAEISNLKYHTSGHIYLTLKDSNNQIAAVIWRRTAKTLPMELKDGIEVLVSGEITIYGRQGKYQISIHSIEPRGTGALLLAFENLKHKLSALGLFDPAHKRALPPLPRKICVVTSPTGAAIQDILNVLERRFPLVAVLIYPVRVQGSGAFQEITNAIREINEHPYFDDVDVMIVGRGGGSLEDLWAFNSEEVANAIYQSRIPIISAVGHEVDITIADLVADRRALTPSEAAELVVPRLDYLYQQLQRKNRQLQLALNNRVTLFRSYLDRLATHRAFHRPLQKIRHNKQRLQHLKQRLLASIERIVQNKQALLAQPGAKLASHQPSLRIRRYQQRLDELAQRISRMMKKRVEWEQRRLQNSSAQLEALSPLAVLRRGYTITYTRRGDSVIRNHDQVKPGDKMWTRMSNSWILSTVDKTGSK